MKRPPIRVLELRSVRGTGGGPEKTILLGAAKSDPDRFKITVCYIRDERDEIYGVDQRAAAMGIDYVEVRERHSLDLRAWRDVARVVRERAIDIVHAHEYKTDVIAAFLGATTGVVPLATAHGWTGNSRRERLLYYPADRRVLARFQRVIAVSDDIATALERAGADRSRVSTILNGIDPAAFVRDPSLHGICRAHLGLQRDEFVIGTVGRLEHQKRVDLLIEAVGRIARGRPDLRLVVAGDGSLRAGLEAHAARVLPAGVCSFLGHRTDVAALHHAFDLFVQASDYEGTPNAVLEAMALETPIVATDAGGTSSLVTDGVHGLVVPSGDAAVLAEAIGRVLSNPEAARRRAGAARRRVETELSFERRVRAVESIYEQLVVGRQRRAHVAGAQCA